LEQVKGQWIGSSSIPQPKIFELVVINISGLNATTPSNNAMVELRDRMA
jgi:hypothetical protein